MVELADAQDLGSCAARRVGSTPTTRIREKARWSVQNRRAFSHHGNTFGNTIKFSGCSHQRIIQHFNELHRAGRTGQRIACQLLHILRVCEPCTFSCPADSALNRFWLTPSAVGYRGIDIFLHGLQAVFLLTDQLKTLAQDTVGAQVTCNAHRAQQIIDLSGQFGNDHS